MIPTLILIGLIVGIFPKPWFLIGLAIAAIAWPLLLVTSGIVELSSTASLLGALALAAANTAIGVVMTLTLIRLVRAFGITRRH